MAFTAGELGSRTTTVGMTTKANCSLWTIERDDGAYEYYTDADQNLDVLMFDGPDQGSTITFLATGATQVSALSKEAGLRSENASVTGFLGGFETEDLIGGVYDFAKVWEHRIDQRWPFIPAFSMQLYWITGVSYVGGETFKFEVEGIARRLKENWGHPYNRRCRWSLGRDDQGNTGAGCGRTFSWTGGSRTGIDITNHTYGDTTPLQVHSVDSSAPTHKFRLHTGIGSGTAKATGINVGRPYKYGRVIWDSTLGGANAGRTFEIGNYDEADGFVGSTGMFWTFDRMKPVEVGDRCVIEEGCEGTFEMCGQIFANRGNFGGPGIYVPGPTRARQGAKI